LEELVLANILVGCEHENDSEDDEDVGLDVVALDISSPSSTLFGRFRRSTRLSARTGISYVESDSKEEG
jgi:hypothetical protein